LSGMPSKGDAPMPAFRTQASTCMPRESSS